MAELKDKACGCKRAATEVMMGTVGELLLGDTPGTVGVRLCEVNDEARLVVAVEGELFQTIEALRASLKRMEDEFHQACERGEVPWAPPEKAPAEQTPLEEVAYEAMKEPMQTPEVGTIVWYQTDERGGKRYILPAIVTCTRQTHADREFFHRTEALGDEASRQIAEARGLLPWMRATEVHLHVMTPGPQGAYTELAVPYDAFGAPRTWRYRDTEGPF